MTLTAGVQASIDQMHQMHDKRGPYYEKWLIASRADLQRRLRELEAEIIALDKEESSGSTAAVDDHLSPA
jgi:uncharacterized protein (DUF2164 family)